MSTQDIHLQLSLAQGNLILEALAERPFKQVFELIGSLNSQAAQAFSAEAEEHDLGKFILNAPQLRLILEVLGEMPYNRVNRLLHSMHQQIQKATAGD
jgi:hypothetical protein